MPAVVSAPYPSKETQSSTAVYVVRYTNIRDSVFLTHTVTTPDRVFCEVCFKMSPCPFCEFRVEEPKWVYMSYANEDPEADVEIEQFLSSTYKCV